MPLCYWTKIPIEKKQQKQLLSLLPPELRSHLNNFQDIGEQQRSACGKVLLQQILSGYSLPWALDYLRFDEYLRPYFGNDFDFNIAHSGEISVCAATKKGRIGVDIEKVQDVDVEEFKDFFTQQEWEQITGGRNELNNFYRFWTRKESLLKAIGKGIYADLSWVDVCGDEVEAEGQIYHLTELYIADGYQACVAMTERETVSCEEIAVIDLLKADL
ncbi:4'-phosphopantetheinyl transferase family protein [Taibaiella soli]|uniref:4'-phosphopantetheinyl transferase domain-containing protein n=1 Tax=Taibaiella soli TaxID=1649169 RepID=A0A2W2AGL2_9BACT|nr:4'-phosphopantetheinyl transferase superfamily protein [Taibaiella soli]PZF71400.1 hypothetical protein DN068_19110 [Taibaiella soli]